MPVLNINGTHVNIDDGFLKLSPDDQNKTVDEIAKSIGTAQGVPSGPSGDHHPDIDEVMKNNDEWARTKAGFASAYQEPLGMSAETMQKNPMLQGFQPLAAGIDAIARLPTAAIRAGAGTVASMAAPFTGEGMANRLERDLAQLPQSIAPELPPVMKDVPTAVIRRSAEEAPAITKEATAVAPEPVQGPPSYPVQTPREGPNVNLLPPETPHAVERRALSAGGASGPLNDMSPETIAHMRSVMEEQGFTPHTIDQRLSEMSSHQFLGELTPSLEADMGAVAAPPGPGKIEVVNSARQRAEEAPDRVRSMFNEAFGADHDLPQINRIIDVEKKAAADPAYQQFKETLITPTPQIDALMPRLEASGSLQAANKALAIEGQPSTWGFIVNGMRPGRNGIPEKRVPTAGAFQAAAEYLSSQVEKAITNKDMASARRFGQLRDDLLTTLDRHPQVGNIWRAARETYAGPAKIQDALALGRRVLTQHIEPGELPFLTSAYSDKQMQALRTGIRSHLELMVGKKDALTAETINAILSPNNIQKMRWALGDRATTRLIQGMQAEREMHGAPNRLFGNSPTALRLEAQKRWTVQPGMLDKMKTSDALGAIGSPVKTAVKVAETLGLNRRKAAQEAAMATRREEAARIFTLQGPERDAVARYLVNGEGLPFSLAGPRR